MTLEIYPDLFFPHEEPLFQTKHFYRENSKHLIYSMQNTVKKI